MNRARLAVHFGMKLLPCVPPCVLAVVVLPSLLTCANAAFVITFDDIPNTYGFGALMPADYAGFAWGPDWALYTEDHYRLGYGNSYGPPSSPMLAHNGGGVHLLEWTVSRDTPFRFLSVEVSTFSQFDAFQPWSSTSLTVEGYAGATLVGSITMPLTVGFQTFNADFNNIDKLVFLNDGTRDHYWALDNITYTEVPEPAATGLIAGLGLVAFGLCRRVRG